MILLLPPNLSWKIAMTAQHPESVGRDVPKLELDLLVVFL